MQEFKVTVKLVEMKEMTGFMEGYVRIDGKRYSFTCILFGNIGGHNVSVKLSGQARKWLKKKGYDADEVEEEIQRSIVTGKFVKK